MVDVHVHLEKGEYSVEWVRQFISWAQKRNISEIYFLEHTHIFRECSCLYEEMAGFNPYQENGMRQNIGKPGLWKNTSVSPDA